MLVGFPLGHALVRQSEIETFRRVCISFDAYLVSFGLARTLCDTGIAPGVAYQVLLATAIVVTSLLWTFFRSRRGHRVDEDRRSGAGDIAQASRPDAALAWASAQHGSVTFAAVSARGAAC